MGWLSIGTKIIPKVFNGGVKATSTLWRGGTAVAGTGISAASAIIRHPKQSAVLAASAYAGWKMLDNPGKSAGTVVGETARELVSGGGEFAHDAVNGFTGEKTVEKVQEEANGVLSDIKETVAESKGILGSLGDTLQGLSNFLGNLFGGNGGNMFSNFFNNLFSGKMSGWGIGALIAAGYMIFGRTGLLGKIGGALLAMMMIGGNSQRQSQEVSQPLAQNQSQDQSHGMRR